MRKRLLDLFCGAGGAAMGYHRAGFEVVGVDIKPQPHYPFAFVQADALEYCAAHGQEFDVIHASPPCQKYTHLNKMNSGRGIANDHPDMIAPTRRALQATRKVYVIENVQGAPLDTLIILCGMSLGLKKLARHRHFESNVMLFAPPCSHRRKPTVGVYGQRPDGRWIVERRYYQGCHVAKNLLEAQVAMGIDWMDWDELTQAVPPAYTEWIGKQLSMIMHP